MVRFGSLTVQASSKGDFCLVEVEGPFEIETALQIYEYSVDQARIHPNCRALMDLRGVSGKPSMDELYQLGCWAAELDRRAGPVLRVGIVGNPPLIGPERFGETVARNRGANMQVFDDWEAAITWISNNRSKEEATAA